MGRLYKRGKVYWYQFAGQRVSTFCQDRKAAEGAAKRIEREAADPDYQAEGPARLEDCMHDFLAFQEVRGRSAETVKMNRKHAGHILRLMGRGCLMSKIRAATVDGYIVARTKEKASASTWQKELSTLRGCLLLAARHEKFNRPLEQVMPKVKREYVPRETWLTIDQVKTLCAHLPKNRAAHVKFIVATSARWGESERARPEDVQRGEVFLRGTKTSKSRRTVPRVKVFTGLLRGVAEAMPFDAWSNVRRDLARACDEAKLPRVTPNDLRRSHGSILRAAGADPHMIASMMGHADSRMVERVYGRLNTDHLKSLINRETGTSKGKKR